MKKETLTTILIILAILLVALLYFAPMKNAKNNTVYIESDVDIEQIKDELREELKEELGDSSSDLDTEVIDHGGDLGSALMTIYVPELSHDGTVLFTSHEVAHSPAILKASYEKLFQNNGVNFYGFAFDRVEIDNNTAHVHLTGSWLPSGMMSQLNFRKLVEATAFQFDTVDSIVVHANGAIFDWCIDDQSGGENGCPTSPRHWIASQS